LPLDAHFGQRDVAIASLPLPTLLLDATGKISHANVMAEEQFGTSARRLAGYHLSEFFEPSSKVIELLRRVAHGESVTDDSFSNRFSHAPYSLHLGPYEGGAIVLMVPEAKRAEVEVQTKRQELAEAVARIALEMAHEVKNPLAALRGASQWLAESSRDAEVAEISNHMLSEVDRIRERIDSFLQLGPRADVAMEAINIHALIDDVCAVSKGMPQGIQLHRVYDPSLPDMLLHGARLRQAIENLWQNAIEAGSTLIEWQTRMAPMTALPGHNGPVVEIRITSDGEPIPDSLKEHLFQPFVTGKERGSGLGLAIVQRVMQEHGGRVKLTSRHGRTTFMLHLPMRVAEKNGEKR